MKPLEKTLAILALVVLTAQTVRHAYLLWFEPRGSVLDKYDQPLKGDIAAAASLDELLQRYDKVRKEADEARKAGAKDDAMAFTPAGMQEPFRSERALRDAINEWESRAKEVRGLRFYWLVGLGLSVAGLIIYRKVNRWYGLTFVITAFSEIIYWTSPTFLGASTREFDRLLANKLVFTVISLALLVVVISFQEIFARERGDKKQSASASA